MLPCAPLFRNKRRIQMNHSLNKKEIEMSKALRKVRPVVEATVVSLALVAAALAVPAVILYAV